jgi:hypothetical protein
MPHIVTIVQPLRLLAVVRLRAMLVSSSITPKARKGVSSAIQGRGLVAVAPIRRR